MFDVRPFFNWMMDDRHHGRYTIRLSRMGTIVNNNLLFYLLIQSFMHTMR